MRDNFSPKNSVSEKLDSMNTTLLPTYNVMQQINAPCTVKLKIFKKHPITVYLKHDTYINLSYQTSNSACERKRVTKI